MEGNFGGGKRWQIWRIVRDSPNYVKPSKLVPMINNLLADLLIRQMLETNQFANVSPCQSFPPYGISFHPHNI